MRIAGIVMCVLAALGPVPSAAETCPTCVLGIWDDPGLTATSGVIVPFVPKDVYLGVKLTNGDTEIAGLELSVHGLNLGSLYLLGAETLGPRALVFGHVASPADTTESSAGVGGATFGWSQPVAAGVGIVRLALYATAPVHDQLLTVKRAYPPLNPEFRAPLVVRADAPAYTKVGVRGGCMVLNPSSQVATDCQSVLQRSPVEPATWGSVKTLFR